MKKLIVTVIALSLFVGLTGIFAQTATTGIIGKGVKVGLNMAKATGDDVQDSKMLMGFAVGGYVTYAFNDMFAVQPELQFTMKGDKEEYDVLGETQTVKTKLSYIEIPVLAKVMLSGGEKIKPNFYIGPGIGFLMSAKAEDEDVKDNMKSTDIGLIGGLGLDYLMGAHKLTFDVRYEAGLTSVVKKPEGATETPKVKNSCISILVGMGF
jgi:hypothetical protein